MKIWCHTLHPKFGKHKLGMRYKPKTDQVGQYELVKKVYSVRKLLCAANEDV